jgi:hypothetical protein
MHAIYCDWANSNTDTRQLADRVGLPSHLGVLGVRYDGRLSARYL